ncbi:MAG: hypothetical protein COV37_15650 [Bdellovibrio sp. CG11_big_fil_rev_8_21_14_0_20_39_38]|nr:MAG: hypothetical protein COV37_15650 [Bdellovibrio sp. CG11_big_fil_rev_8_21_14_0_20_39_38]
MSGKLRFFKLIPLQGVAIALLLTSCIGGQGGKTKADCSAGQVLNSVSRKCEGAKVTASPPTLSLKNLSTSEDSGAQSLTLAYTDSENDPVTACTVTAPNSSGLRKSLDLQGLRFTSKSYITKAQYVQVRIVETGVLNVDTYTAIDGVSPDNVASDFTAFKNSYLLPGLGNPYLIYITVANYPGTTSLAVKNAIASHPIASQLVDVTLLTNQSMQTSATASLTEIPCSCSGGVCTSTMETTQDFSGTTDFTYSLTDNDGTSTQTTSLTVSPVNDAPEIDCSTIALNPDAVCTNVGGNITVTYTLDEDQVLNGFLDVDLEVTPTDKDDLSGDLKYKIATNPTYGTLTISNQTTGLYTYTPNADNVTSDTFEINVEDPGLLTSNKVTVVLNFNPLPDFPVGTLNSVANFNEDSGPTSLVTLTYTDAEGDLATSCTITNIYKLYVSTPCSCDGSGVCTVGIKGYPNYNGSSAYFFYTVTNGATNPTSNAKYVSVSYISPVSDAPFAFATSSGGDIDGNGNIYFDESATHVPATKTFTLNTATDVEGGTLVYEIVALPNNGTLANCMGLDGSSNADLICDYTPKDGNMNGIGTKATVTVGDLVFTAKNYGTYGDDITINLISATGTPTGAPYAWATGKTVNVLVLSSTIPSEVVTAITASTEASSLVSVLSTGITPVSAISIQLNSGTPGSDGADYFTYRVRDSLSYYSQTVKVNISINPVDDSPVVCEYSKFSQAPECGLAGCREYGSPVASLTPSTSGLFYYDESTGACWKSDTTLADKWSLVSGNISDHSINEKDVLVIKNIAVDEGGGDATEDTQMVQVFSVASSNTILVPTANIKFYFNDVEFAVGANFGDMVNSEDQGEFRIEVTPVSGYSGSSTIDLVFKDTGGNTTSLSFVMTVNGVTAQHGGWTNIYAIGPKIDKSDSLKDSNINICPYSQNLCGTNAACKGTTVPTLQPTHIDAIYWNSSADTCYKINSSSLATTVQALSYTAKKSGGASISYSAGGTAGFETINVTGTAINVLIQDGVSTSTQIKAAIEASNAANKLVSVSDPTPGTAQTTQASTTLAGPTNALWTSYSSYCNISPSAYEPACASLGSSCMGNGAPTINATTLNSMYYDQQNDVCYRSTDLAGTWESYKATGQVYLSWNAFTVSGTGSITGYNVYRRVSSENFDYDRPVNRSVLSSSATSFLDNAVNSYEAPVPNTVYYYEVRPIINSLPTSTTSSTKIVRALVPPNNRAFAHRWIINKTICGMMNKTTDPSNNFRCLYEGPGDTGLAPGSNHYDIGSDLIVDRFELGCHYTASPACSQTADGQCIGINDPTTDGISAASGSIYYSRGNGKCYETNGVTWSEVTGASVIPEPEKAYLPPLVHLTQSDAAAFCTAQGNISGILGLTSAVPQRLPSRKEQIAYSLWDTSSITDTTIATRETGLSLNSSSKCNSSSASGYESSYSDDEAPSSSTLFTLPGTTTSNIRSVMTGSEVTKSCTSRFGVQDAVGNVAEWAIDRLTCDNLSNCIGRISTDTVALTGATNDFQPGTGTDPYLLWLNNGILGPCVDSNSDDICDTYLDSWALEDERYGAGRMFIPMGIPAHTDLPTVAPTSQVLPYALEIGPTSGITAIQLHDDTVTYNSHYIFAETAACGGFTSGGQYTAGAGAGIYNFEVLPCSATAYGYTTIQDVSYRSLIAASSTVTITMTDSGADGDTICAISATGASPAVTITLDDDCTATDVANAVNAGTSNTIVRAEVSGSAVAIQSALVTPVTLTDTSAAALPKRVDVGFRCVAPVDPLFYSP